ncbi:MAG: hypothetical protein DI529_13380 [Chryseobacterium sp.]|nr:MAG: hypothetical protein DI529_13380 [Chryseobacterium sp.]
MGFYISPSVQVGYNLGNSIKDKQNQDSPYYQQYIRPNLPNDFTYGIGIVGGYQLLSFFALGTGLKYNYIADSLHLLSWTIQPKFFLGKDNGWKGIIELEYGSQINKANVENSKHYGLKIGFQDSFSKRLNQEFALFFQSHDFTFSNAAFVGFSISATIFSNKNYTVYGKD